MAANLNSVMTIEELRKALDAIPNKGAINKAVRQSLREQIYALMLEQEAGVQ